MGRPRRQHGEGSVFQRSRDGRWVARADLGWRNGKRDQRLFTADTSAEAIEKRALFLARRRDGFTPPPGRPPYVSEWMLHWLHNIARRKVEASTWHKSYRQKVTDHIVPYFERVPLPGLDEEMVEAFHAHLEDKGLSAATITQIHRIMSSALRVAVVRKRMIRNPCSNVTPPQIDRAEPAVPDDDEVLAILRECEGARTGPRWVTAIATGVRQGEALGLLWPYVDTGDLEAAHIRVEWELVRLPWQHGCEDAHACGEQYHVRPCPRPCPKIRPSGRRHTCIRAGDDRCCPPGCGAHARRCPLRRDGGLRLKRPKSTKSRREIDLPPYAAARLRAWKVDQKAERLAHPGWRGWAHDPAGCGRRLRKGEWVCPDCRLPAEPGLVVFANPDGTPADPRRDWDDWDALQEAAGVERRGTHASRHGFATALIEAGEDIRVVQELMGHSTPDFTRRAYVHVTRKMRRSAAGSVERRLRGGQS